MDGGHCHGILLKAQLVEFVVLIGQVAGAVALVDGGDNRFSAPLEHDRDVAVGGGQSGADVAQEHDDIGVINGNLRLHFHLGEDNIVGLRLDSAGVNDDQLLAAPFGFAVNAVARDAGRILHDGAPLADELVEQRGFSHIGAPHDGDNGF